MTTEQEHAATLADEIERDDPVVLHHGMDRQALVVRALRAYAKTAPTDADVRERVAKAICKAAGWKTTRDTWTAFLDEADAALATIRPGDKLTSGVLVPEQATDEMKRRFLRSATDTDDTKFDDWYRVMLAAAKESHRE